MAKYEKTKKQRKIEKQNLIKAYKNAIKRGTITEKNGKKEIAEITKEYKEYGV